MVLFGLIYYINPFIYIFLMGLIGLSMLFLIYVYVISVKNIESHIFYIVKNKFFVTYFKNIYLEN